MTYLPGGRAEAEQETSGDRSGAALEDRQVAALDHRLGQVSAFFFFFCNLSEGTL